MRTMPLGFDPADQYVVMRPFTFNGVLLNPGDSIPKSMDERRMRSISNCENLPSSPPGSQRNSPPRKENNVIRRRNFLIALIALLAIPPPASRLFGPFARKRQRLRSTSH